MTNGITLFGGITIAASSYTNNNVLTSTQYGVVGIYSNIAATVTNNALIDFPRAYDVSLYPGSTFINSSTGTIAGGKQPAGGIVMQDGGAIGTVINYGLVSSPAGVFGHFGLTNGSKMNTTARIDGYAGDSGTLINFGTMTGGAGAGTSGATNGASDSTAAYISGVHGLESAGSITNYGTIYGTGTNGSGAAATAPGMVTNGISGRAIGTIIGTSIGVNGDGTVKNYGLIGATLTGGVGVAIGASPGSIIENGAPGATGARIYGYANGIRSNYSVTNYGTIAGTGTAGIGINHNRGGPIVNGLSGSTIGLISGVAGGIGGGGGPLTNYGVILATGTAAYGVSIMSVTNYGTISALGGSQSVGVTGNGSNSQLISNTTHGLIEASQSGVVLTNPGVTFANDGTITGQGTGSNGVDVAAVCQAINSATGVISGGAYGVIGGVTTFANYGRITGGTGAAGLANLTNGGTISGTGTAGIAVSMAGPGILTLLPGAKFNGIVIAGTNGNSQGVVHYFSTLVLGGTNAAGTLRDLGSQYQDFGNVTVGAGANWTLSGSAALLPGAYLTVLGRLDVGGTTISGPTSGGVIVASGGTLFGHGTVASQGVRNIGTVEANGGMLSLGAVGGNTGSFVIDGEAAMEFSTQFGNSPRVTFAGTGAGTALVLDSPSTFSGTITALAPGDEIDLVKTIATSATIVGSTLVIALQNGGTLNYALNDPGTIIAVAVPSDNAGGTDIVPFGAAEPSPHSPEPVIFQNVHIGAVATQQLSIANSAPADGAHENLDADFGAASPDLEPAGTITGLAPGVTNTTSLSIGLNTTSDGIKSGIVTLDLSSDGTDLDGNGQTTLQPQTVSVTGTVYAYAALTGLPAVVNFGAARLGGVAPTQTLSIGDGTTADPFQESLIYNFNGLPGAFSALSDGSGTIVSGGSAAPELELTTGTAGDFSGTTITVGVTSTGTGTSNLPPSVQPRQVQLNGKIYAPAVAVPSATSINFGVVHVGQTIAQALTIMNTASGALTDSLIGGFTELPDGFTSPGTIAAGVTGGVAGTLAVDLNTDQSGVLSGSGTLALSSHDPDLADIPVLAKKFVLSGTIDNFATSAIEELSGGGTFSQSGSDYTLALGTIDLDTTAPVITLGVKNAATGLADLLSGTLQFAGAGFVNSGPTAFSGLAAGQVVSMPTISLPTGQAGSFSETVTLLPTGSNIDFSGPLAQEVVTVTGTVTLPARTLVWTGANGIALTDPANWSDTTLDLTPATLAPDSTDTVSFDNGGGAMTGTSTVAALAFSGDGAWHLESGATLNSLGGIAIGAAEPSVVLIDQGSSLTGTSAIVSGPTGTSESAVNVSGPGSSWQLAGLLDVGTAGSAALQVSGGATVTADSLDAGDSAAAVAQIGVSGAGSSLIVTNAATVAGDGTGVLSVLTGATFAAASLTIGSLGDSSGALVVSGAGSVIQVSGALDIGTAFGFGDLTVGPGAAVRAGAVNLEGQAVLEGGLLDPTVQLINQGQTAGGFGTIAAGDIVDEGAIQAGGNKGSQKLLIVQGTLLGGGTLTVDGTVPGSVPAGILQINAGGTLELSGAVLNAASTTFTDNLTPTGTYTVNNSVIDVNFVDGAGVLLLDDIAGFAGTITTWQSGDSFVITGGTLAGLNVVNNDTLTVADAGSHAGAGGIDQIIFGAAVSAAGFKIVNNDTIQAQVPCFLAGTRIATAAGGVAVEALRIGDRVLLDDGRTEPVVWIGSRAVHCATHPTPETVWPVRIRRGAFGENTPRRDLYLSPDHAVFVNGRLVPAKLLINGTSIAQTRRDLAKYFHVKLPRHAVILAEGLTVESYLDTGDRDRLADGATIRLLPDFAGRRGPNAAHIWEMCGAARLIMEGPELTAIRGALESRGSALAGFQPADSAA